MSRRVVDSGVLPDPELFFGVEDFDFFCRAREAGWEVLVDGDAARAVAGQQTNDGRDRAIREDRPNDAAEAWRAYYHARNSSNWPVATGDRSGTHGTPHTRPGTCRPPAVRSRASAIVHGLWDGARGRLGQHPRYGRDTGEYGPTDLGTD